MVNRAFFYRIEGFVPPAPNERRLGMYGFSIELDRDFARKALELELPDGARQRLVEDAQWIARGIWGNEFEREARYRFWGNTCLLQVATVFGNACSIGATPNEIQEIEREVSDAEVKKQADIYKFPLQYNPHNVDHHLQAYGLLAMWTNWADKLETLLGMEAEKR